jgi:hypothetical protein
MYFSMLNYHTNFRILKADNVATILVLLTAALFFSKNMFSDTFMLGFRPHGQNIQCTSIHVTFDKYVSMLHAEKRVLVNSMEHGMASKGMMFIPHL